MKKRMGFVSNSSSTSFIIGFDGVDPNIVDIIRGLFKHRISKVWDNEVEEYVEVSNDDSISIEVDMCTDLSDILDMDFLEKVGCTTKWED